jgi:hypothetical protein
MANHLTISEVEYFGEAKFTCFYLCGHPHREGGKTHLMKTPFNFHHMLSLMFKKTAKNLPQCPWFIFFLDHPCAPTEIVLGQELDCSFSNGMEA